MKGPNKQFEPYKKPKEVLLTPTFLTSFINALLMKICEKLFDRFSLGEWSTGKVLNQLSTQKL